MSLLDKTLGVLNIGNALNAFLFGVSTVQIYLYYRRGAKDPVSLKVIIFALWLCSAFEMALYLQGVYYYTVTNFANPLALASPPWSILAYLVPGLVGDCVVTGVYACQVWRLGKKSLHPLVIISVMMLVSLGMGLAFFALALGHTYEEINAQYSWLWYVTFGSEFVADATISISLCIMLYKRRTGISRTDSLVRVLMLYSINTCALASLMRGGSIIAYALGQGTFIFVLISTLQPRIIFSSLLAFLNSRRSMQELYFDTPISIHLSRFSAHLRYSRKGSEPSSDVEVAQIRVDTTTEQVYDLPSAKNTLDP